MEDISGAIVAQLGVLLRAAITGGVGYLVWTFVSGGSFDHATYGTVVLSLWAATNAVFWIAKTYRPHMITTARSVEEEL